VAEIKDPVCVVGLGNIGGSVLANLVEKGHDVVGFDPDPDARERAANAGARVTDVFTDAVAGAGVTITSLPDAPVVKSVWLGDDGLVAHATSGSFVVELSTIDPDSMREIATPAKDAGLRVLDCAVSGGPVEARNGTLSLIVGADDTDLDDARSLLDDVGSVSHTGPVGTGKIVKLVNNLMSMGNVLVAAEAFAVGVAAGMDPQRLYDVLSVSGGRSHHFTKRFPKALSGDFDPGFTMRLGEKDLGLGLELARSVGVPAPAAATTRQMYTLALAEGLADADIVALLKLYQRWAGEEGAE